MRRIIRICDKCSQDIVTGRAIVVGKHDLCEFCAMEILKNYFEVPKAVPDPEEKPVKKEEKDVKYTGKKKPAKKAMKKEAAKKTPDRKPEKEEKRDLKDYVKNFDSAGAQALRDAGWSCYKIAAEMKCSPQTVTTTRMFRNRRKRRNGNSWMMTSGGWEILQRKRMSLRKTY